MRGLRSRAAAVDRIDERRGHEALSRPQGEPVRPDPVPARGVGERCSPLCQRPPGGALARRSTPPALLEYLMGMEWKILREVGNGLVPSISPGDERPVRNARISGERVGAGSKGPAVSVARPSGANDYPRGLTRIDH